MRILLIEDDPIMAEIVEESLVERNYLVEVAADGRAGLELATSLSYDLILLDLVLPKLDGIKFCQELRNNGDRTPVLLMTATEASINKVAGLDAGADDYLVKPFDLQELLARIRALLRRGTDLLKPELEWGQLRLNPNNCQVSYNGKPLHLTAKEYSILEIFLRNPERIFSQSSLLDRLWSFEEPPCENTVRTHIKSLRQKLKKADSALDPIETIYGQGYRLRTLQKRSYADKEEEEEEEEEKQEEKQERNGLRQTNLLVAAKVSVEGLEEQFPPQDRIAVRAKTDTVSRSPRASGMKAIWGRHKQKYLDRLSIIERSLASIDANLTFREEDRKQAKYQAHTLKAIGSFGLETASQKCRQVEKILEFNPLSAQMKVRLSRLLLELRQELELGEEATEANIQSSAALGSNGGNGKPWGLNGERHSFFKGPATKLEAMEGQDLEGRRRRLLIVDDDASLGSMLCAEAAIWGMEAENAISIEQARESIACQLPDVVLLDLCFPDSADNGLELLDELTASKRSIPVVVCTAKESLAERVRVARLGGQGFLQKPVSPVRVMEAVGAAIEKTTSHAVKLLVVDDDPKMLRRLEKELCPWGFQLTLLEEPEEFWEMLETTVPDLLILDVEMPNISGIDLCAVVRNDSRWCELPVLCLSERTDAQTIYRVFSAGADDYIQKPFVGPELVARVLNRSDRSKLRRKLIAARNQLF